MLYRIIKHLSPALFSIIACILIMAPMITQSTPDPNKEQEEKLEEVLIISPTSNNYHYIELQKKCFDKYLTHPYKLVVFNDAQDSDTKEQIDQLCANLNIPCFRVPQENRPIGTVYSWATYRHGQAMEHILKTIGISHNGIVTIIDSDMFLIKEFSIIDFLGNHDIAGLARGPFYRNHAYMWPGLLFFNMNTLPHKQTISLVPDDNLRFDTGGALCHYFKANPGIKKLFFDKGRLKFGRPLGDLTSYRDNFPQYVFSEPSREYYVQCGECATKAADQVLCTNTTCTHKTEVLQQLGFRSDIIDIINAYNIPYGAEFLLGDTFFHLSGSSGYYERSPELIEHNTRTRIFFMNYILQ